MDAATEARPLIKKASPHDVKKAFGVHAERVLAVIDSHADCLEGIVAQVTVLTELPDVQTTLIADLSARVARLERPWWKRVIDAVR